MIFSLIQLGVPVVEFFADVRDEGFDDAVVEAVDPAVDGDLLATCPGVFDDGGACDMAGLGEHIEFAESVGGGLGRKGVELLAVGAVEAAYA